MMNYGLGLIKANGIYYNPAQIKTIQASEHNNNSTVIKFTNQSDGNYHITGEICDTVEIKNCNADKFANAFVQATRTGQIINIEA